MKKVLLWSLYIVVAILLFNMFAYDRRVQGDKIIVINKFTNSAKYVPIKTSYKYSLGKRSSHEGKYAQIYKKQKEACGEICNEKFDLDKCMECTNNVKVDTSK